MTENSDALLRLTYTVPKEDFQNYALADGMKRFDAKKRKSVVTGAIETLIAAALIAWVIATGTAPGFIYVLCTALLFLGIYTLVFYTHLLPRLLFKNAGASYDNSKYLNKEISLKVYSDRIEETTPENEGTYFFISPLKIFETKGGIALEVSSSRTLLLPASMPASELDRAREILELINKTL